MRTPPTVAIRRLAVARFISVAGSMAAYTALIDLVFRRTDGSAIALSLTTIFTMGPSGSSDRSAESPTGGTGSERWSRRISWAAPRSRSRVRRSDGAVSGSWFASRLSARTEPTALVVGWPRRGRRPHDQLRARLLARARLQPLWGVGDAATVVAKTGIPQRRTPDAVRGRVVAASESIAHVALVAGFLAAGPTIETLGAQPTYAVGGAAALLAGLLTWSIVGPMRRERSTRTRRREGRTWRPPPIPCCRREASGAPRVLVHQASEIATCSSAS